MKKTNRKLVLAEPNPEELQAKADSYLRAAIVGIANAFIAEARPIRNPQGRMFMPYEMIPHRVIVREIHGSRVYYEEGVGWVICALIKAFPGQLWTYRDEIGKFELINHASQWPFNEDRVFVSRPEPTARSRREA